MEKPETAAVKALAYAVLAAALAGCAHAPEPVAGPHFALTYIAGRHGEIEPCGCHARPLGGIDRELNARTALRRAEVPEWSLTSGPQLAHESGPPSAGYGARKNSFLVDAWNVLGIDVAAADARDFADGATAFHQFARATRSQWISANLYAGGRALFPAFATKVFGPHQVQVFGATTCHAGPVKHLECREPIAALRSAIAAAHPTGPVVLLSSLDDDEVARVFRDLPEVAIVLNSPAFSALPGVVEEPGHRWLANPTPRGRTLVRMEIAGGRVEEAVSETTPIDARFDEPANPLRKLLEKWKTLEHDEEVGAVGNSR